MINLTKNIHHTLYYKEIHFSIIFLLFYTAIFYFTDWSRLGILHNDYGPSEIFL